MGFFGKRRASEGSEAAPEGNPDDTEILLVTVYSLNLPSLNSFILEMRMKDQSFHT